MPPGLPRIRFQARAGTARSANTPDGSVAPTDSDLLPSPVPGSSPLEPLEQAAHGSPAPPGHPPGHRPLLASLDSCVHCRRDALRLATGKMPTYARWPPISQARSNVASVAVRRGASLAVRRNELGALPLTWTPGVRSPRRPVGAHERGASIVPANRVAWTPAGFTHYHRAHGHTDMRIVFLPEPLARRIPGRPAVFTASGLAREVLLTLTGPREYDRFAQARLRRVLVDELHEAHEQPLQLPEPHDDRLRAIAQMLYEDPAGDVLWPSSGERSAPAPALSAGCSTTNSA